ncbi:DMT family transporter [Paracraurococcus lichenis]|uniref:DMT family transporter n=1 Tax=Paracraurococcus lichenis TaxID=3064888 RepID=A0ABT9DZZ3_9PROT|nr:DMT family transporter [Paracraurococcus sp. LOR1-02]MDO9709454.1 DMT family transporter [Paracraurococcus sp. LOR1-02]
MSAALASPTRRPAVMAGLDPALLGLVWGLVAALAWGSYLAFARVGVAGGLAPLDFSLLRYGVAGLILLPVLLRRRPLRLGGLGWRRGLLLAVLAGPPFILASTLGYRFAPLAHGAVVQPAALTIGAMLAAALVLGERVAPLRWLGLGVVLLGLGIVSGAGFEGGAWRGDLAFAAAGLLWAGYTLASRLFRADPLTATAVVSVLGGVASLGLWLGFGDPAAMLAQGWRVLALQAAIQGGLVGALSVFAFSRAVALLGAARAAMFPAMVPAFAVLFGIPVAGEWPEAAQWIGLGVVMAGLPVAMGLLRR